MYLQCSLVRSLHLNRRLNPPSCRLDNQQHNLSECHRNNHLWYQRFTLPSNLQELLQVNHQGNPRRYLLSNPPTLRALNQVVSHSQLQVFNRSCTLHLSHHTNHFIFQQGNLLFSQPYSHPNNHGANQVCNLVFNLSLIHPANPVGILLFNQLGPLRPNHLVNLRDDHLHSHPIILQEDLHSNHLDNLLRNRQNNLGINHRINPVEIRLFSRPVFHLFDLLNNHLRNPEQHLPYLRRNNQLGSRACVPRSNLPEDLPRSLIFTLALSPLSSLPLSRSSAQLPNHPVHRQLNPVSVPPFTLPVSPRCNHQRLRQSNRHAFHPNSLQCLLRGNLLSNLADAPLANQLDNPLDYLLFNLRSDLRSNRRCSQAKYHPHNLTEAPRCTHHINPPWNLLNNQLRNLLKFLPINLSCVQHLNLLINQLCFLHSSLLRNHRRILQSSHLATLLRSLLSNLLRYLPFNRSVTLPTDQLPNQHGIPLHNHIFDRHETPRSNLSSAHLCNLLYVHLGNHHVSLLCTPACSLHNNQVDSRPACRVSRLRNRPINQPQSQLNGPHQW